MNAAVAAQALLLPEHAPPLLGAARLHHQRDLGQPHVVLGLPLDPDARVRVDLELALGRGDADLREGVGLDHDRDRRTLGDDLLAVQVAEAVAAAVHHEHAAAEIAGAGDGERVAPRDRPVPVLRLRDRFAVATLSTNGRIVGPVATVTLPFAVATLGTNGLRVRPFLRSAWVRPSVLRAAWIRPPVLRTAWARPSALRSARTDPFVLSVGPGLDLLAPRVRGRSRRTNGRGGRIDLGLHHDLHLLHVPVRPGLERHLRALGRADLPARAEQRPRLALHVRGVLVGELDVARDRVRGRLRRARRIAAEHAPVGAREGGAGEEEGNRVDGHHCGERESSAPCPAIGHRARQVHRQRPRRGVLDVRVHERDRVPPARLDVLALALELDRRQ